MYTSMMGLAMAAFFGSATPNWQTDYREAKVMAARENKPLVVVLCTGEAAWNGITTDGSLDVASKKILRDSYICVYVNTESEKGHRLSVDFNLLNGPSMIISDKSGELQAYRHEGAQSAAKIAEVLRQYADPTRVVSTTDSNRTTQSNYAPANYAPSYFTPTAIQQQCLT